MLTDDLNLLCDKTKEGKELYLKFYKRGIECPYPYVPLDKECTPIKQTYNQGLLDYPIGIFLRYKDQKIQGSKYVDFWFYVLADTFSYNGLLINGDTPLRGSRARRLFNEFSRFDNRDRMRIADKIYNRWLNTSYRTIPECREAYRKLRGIFNISARCQPEIPHQIISNPRYAHQVWGPFSAVHPKGEFLLTPYGCDICFHGCSCEPSENQLNNEYLVLPDDWEESHFLWTNAFNFKWNACNNPYCLDIAKYLKRGYRDITKAFKTKGNIPTSSTLISFPPEYRGIFKSQRFLDFMARIKEKKGDLNL